MLTSEVLRLSILPSYTWRTDVRLAASATIPSSRLGQARADGRQLHKSSTTRVRQKSFRRVAVLFWITAATEETSKDLVHFHIRCRWQATDAQSEKEANTMLHVKRSPKQKACGCVSVVERICAYPRRESPVLWTVAERCTVPPAGGGTLVTSSCIGCCRGLRFLCGLQTCNAPLSIWIPCSGSASPTADLFFSLVLEEKVHMVYRKITGSCQWRSDLTKCNLICPIVVAQPLPRA